MNIATLIKLLENYPGDMTVVARGYESGYDDIDGVQEDKLIYRTDVEWYDGNWQHEDVGFGAKTVLIIR